MNKYLLMISCLLVGLTGCWGGHVVVHEGEITPEQVYALYFEIAEVMNVDEGLRAPTIDLYYGVSCGVKGLGDFQGCMKPTPFGHMIYAKTCSSLVHELGHAINHDALGSTDPNHELDWVFLLYNKALELCKNVGLN